MSNVPKQNPSCVIKPLVFALNPFKFFESKGLELVYINYRSPESFGKMQPFVLRERSGRLIPFKNLKSDVKSVIEDLKSAGITGYVKDVKKLVQFRNKLLTPKDVAKLHLEIKTVSDYVKNTYANDGHIEVGVTSNFIFLKAVYSLSQKDVRRQALLNSLPFFDDSFVKILTVLVRHKYVGLEIDEEPDPGFGMPHKKIRGKLWTDWPEIKVEDYQEAYRQYLEEKDEERKSPGRISKVFDIHIKDKDDDKVFVAFISKDARRFASKTFNRPFTKEPIILTLLRSKGLGLVNSLEKKFSVKRTLKDLDLSHKEREEKIRKDLFSKIGSENMYYELIRVAKEILKRR